MSAFHLTKLEAALGASDTKNLFSSHNAANQNCAFTGGCRYIAITSGKKIKIPMILFYNYI